jgi:hypothetical protein
MLNNYSLSIYFRCLCNILALGLLILHCALPLNAQSRQPRHVNQVFTISGGRFMAPGNYVRFGVWRPLENKFFHFDSLLGNYTNAALCHENQLFFNADTFLLSYDARSLKRLQKKVCKGVQNLIRYNQELIVAKGFGAQDAYLEIRDANTLDLIASAPVSSIPFPCKGLYVYKDKLYVTYNQPGAIDRFPPFGVYSDTLGFVVVMNLSNYTIEKTIPLDAVGAGANAILVNDTAIFTFNGQAQTFLHYNRLTQAIQTFPLPINNQGRILGVYQNVAYFQSNRNKIIGFRLDTKEIVEQGAITGSYAAGLVDTTEGNVFLTQTDYQTKGELLIFSPQRTLRQTLAIGVSPEAIAIHYEQAPKAQFTIKKQAEYVLQTQNTSQGSIYFTQWSLWNKAQQNLTSAVNFEQGTSPTSFDASINVRNVLPIDSLRLRLIVSNYGKSDTAWLSFPTNLIVSIFAEKNQESRLIVFPNPVSLEKPEINLIVPPALQGLSGKYQLCSLSGQSLYEQELSPTLETFVFPSGVLFSLSPGVYFLKIFIGNHCYAQPIIFR